jgi:hypothetical protein
MLSSVAFVLSAIHIGDNHWLITNNTSANTLCQLLVHITTVQIVTTAPGYDSVP